MGNNTSGIEASGNNNGDWNAGNTTPAQKPHGTPSNDASNSNKKRNNKTKNDNNKKKKIGFEGKAPPSSPLYRKTIRVGNNMMYDYTLLDETVLHAANMSTIHKASESFENKKMTQKSEYITATLDTSSYDRIATDETNGDRTLIVTDPTLQRQEELKFGTDYKLETSKYVLYHGYMESMYSLLLGQFDGRTTTAIEANPNYSDVNAEKDPCKLLAIMWQVCTRGVDDATPNKEVSIINCYKRANNYHQNQ